MADMSDTVRNLTSLFEEEEDLRQSLEVTDGKCDDKAQLRVLLRLRNLNSDQVAQPCLHAAGHTSIALVPPITSANYKSGERGATYSFSRVFGAGCSQSVVYEEAVAPLVTSACAGPGGGGVVLCYGITAAGKTYTIEGTEAEPGLLPRSLAAVSAGIAKGATLSVAHYEVYNERVYDLLGAKGERGGGGGGGGGGGMEEEECGRVNRGGGLKVMEGADGRVCIPALTWLSTSNSEQAFKLLMVSLEKRACAETGLNAMSSRSHSVVSLRLTFPSSSSQACDTTAGGPCSGKRRRGLKSSSSSSPPPAVSELTFVDLAGSERAARTGNDGLRLKESAAINSSLMALGRCLETLRWNTQHPSAPPRVVPFRESKVTHIFRDVLHGRGRLALLVNVSPAEQDYDETSHVLRYAALAQGIACTQGGRQTGAGGVDEKKEGGVTKKPRALPRVAMLANAQRKEYAMRVGGIKRQKCNAEEDEGPGVKLVNNDTNNNKVFLTSAEEELEKAYRARERKEGRYAGVEEEEEEEEEFVSDGEDDAPVDLIASLREEIDVLREQLCEAEVRAANLETEIREEVAGEMAEMLRDVEAQHQAQMAAREDGIRRKTLTSREVREDTRRFHGGKGRVKGQEGGEEKLQDEDGATTAAQRRQEVINLQSLLKEKDLRIAALERSLSEQQADLCALEVKYRDSQKNFALQVDEERAQLRANMDMEVEVRQDQLERRDSLIAKLKTENSEMKEYFVSQANGAGCKETSRMARGDVPAGLLTGGESVRDRNAAPTPPPGPTPQHFRKSVGAIEPLDKHSGRESDKAALAEDEGTTIGNGEIAVDDTANTKKEECLIGADTADGIALVRSSSSRDAPQAENSEKGGDSPTQDIKALISTYEAMSAGKETKTRMRRSSRRPSSLTAASAGDGDGDGTGKRPVNMTAGEGKKVRRVPLSTTGTTTTNAPALSSIPEQQMMRSAPVDPDPADTQKLGGDKENDDGEVGGKGKRRRAVHERAKQIKKAPPRVRRKLLTASTDKKLLDALGEGEIGHTERMQGIGCTPIARRTRQRGVR